MPNRDDDVEPQEPLLQVSDLTVTFASREGGIEAVRGVSVEVAAGEVL